MLITKNSAIYELMKQNEGFRKTIASLKTQIQHLNSTGLSQKQSQENSYVDQSREEIGDDSVIEDLPEYLDVLPVEALELIAPEIAQHEQIFNKQNSENSERL